MENVITKADELKKFTKEQIELFEEAIKMGSSEDVACVEAGVAPADKADLIAGQPAGWREGLRRQSFRPLAEVSKRMRAIMLAANDVENPMPMKDALTILERLSPEKWKEKKAVDVTSDGQPLSVNIFNYGGGYNPQ
jgi:hypothetical protein